LNRRAKRSGDIFFEKISPELLALLLKSLLSSVRAGAPGAVGDDHLHLEQIDE
jgi:hypothetical protein